MLRVLTVVLQNNDDDTLAIFIFSLLAFLLGVALIFWGVRVYRKSRLVANTATENVRSMAVGRTELQGVASPIGEPFRQPFRDEPCLYASWKIEEYRRQRSSKNNRNKRSWETIASGSYTEPFVLDDGTGKALVNATSSATWQLTSGCSSTWRVGSRSNPDSMIAEFCQREGISPRSSNRRRYSQTVLRPDTEVYVLGESTQRGADELTEWVEQAELSRAEQRLYLTRDESSGRFIISDMDESQLSSYYGRRAPLYIIAGIVVSAGGLYGLLWLVL